MNEKLLPCPFCGGEAIVVKTERCGRYIGCWDCGGRTEEFETDYAGSAHDKAIAAWNRRAGKDINVATNADRIQGANIDDLPDVIVQIVDELYEDGAPSRDFIERWLQQPAETEGTE